MVKVSPLVATGELSENISLEKITRYMIQSRVVLNIKRKLFKKKGVLGCQEDAYLIFLGFLWFQHSHEDLKRSLTEMGILRGRREGSGCCEGDMGQQGESEPGG